MCCNCDRLATGWLDCFTSGMSSECSEEESQIILDEGLFKVVLEYAAGVYYACDEKVEGNSGGYIFTFTRRYYRECGNTQECRD